MRYFILSLTLLALWVAPSVAWAADVDGFHPPCGAPGDRVYVQGSDFTPRPVVTFGGVEAEVVRTGVDVLLCRVPRGLAEGPVELQVDGAPAPHRFQTRAAGKPVIHGLGAAAGTGGQSVLIYGRRLQRGRVAFLDAKGSAVARVPVVGGRRAGMLLLPETLPPGHYVLVLTNGDGLSTGACSPRIEVAVAGAPELWVIHPTDAALSHSASAGQRVRCLGTNLGPAGPCRVGWTDRHGVRSESRGLADGYGSVRTAVPGALTSGEPYDVVVELANGESTAPVTWTPGKRTKPDAVTATPSTMPAGCAFALQGVGLDGSIDDVRAALTSEHGTVGLDVVVHHPGGLGHGAAWILRVPPGISEGEYEVSLHLGDRGVARTSLRVAQSPLTVTGLWPTRIDAASEVLPTLIEGAGFGAPSAGDDLRVVWTDGTHTREGTIVFHCDGVIRILPLCTYRAGSIAERWSVYVLRGQGAGTRVAKAGIVTCGP